MTLRELPKEVLDRGAVVYIRQSTGAQVQENLESQRRQYELVDLARRYGFRDVAVIDADLGRSASGTMDRPGFRDLVGRICERSVGAVFCLEASRLARNGRDWHHLLELCGLVGAYVVDSDGVHDPGLPNDRLLLGLKGTMSEFELSLIRKRLVDAAVAKARRGELRIGVPVGYVWSRDDGLMMDPDRRIQDAIRTVFCLFERLGSATQVLLHMRREGLLFPRPAEAKSTSPLSWQRPVYRNVTPCCTTPSTRARTRTERQRCKLHSSTDHCGRSMAERVRWRSGRCSRAITMRHTSRGRRSNAIGHASRETHSLRRQGVRSLLVAAKACSRGCSVAVAAGAC